METNEMTKNFERILNNICNNMKLFSCSSKQYLRQMKVLSNLREATTRLNGKSFEASSKSELLNFLKYLQHIGFNSLHIEDSLRQRLGKTPTGKAWKNYKKIVVNTWLNFIDNVEKTSRERNI